MGGSDRIRLERLAAEVSHSLFFKWDEDVGSALYPRKVLELWISMKRASHPSPKP